MKQPVSDDQPVHPTPEELHPAKETADLEHQIYTSTEREQEEPALELPAERPLAEEEEPAPELPVEEPVPTEVERAPEPPVKTPVPTEVERAPELPAEKPLPPVHYAVTPTPISLPSTGMSPLAWLLLSISLMLALVSFMLTGILFYRLYQVQHVAGEMLDTADQAMARLESQETIVFPYHFQGTVPFEGEVPFKQEFEFPFKGTVPIKTTVQVDTVLGTIAIPIDTSVPVDTKVPVDLDIVVPVSTEVEIDQVISVPIRLNESPIKEILVSFRHGLDELRAMFE